MKAKSGLPEKVLMGLVFLIVALILLSALVLPPLPDVSPQQAAQTGAAARMNVERTLEAGK